MLFGHLAGDFFHAVASDIAAGFVSYIANVCVAKPPYAIESRGSIDLVATGALGVFFSVWKVAAENDGVIMRTVIAVTIFAAHEVADFSAMFLAEAFHEELKITFYECSTFGEVFI